MRQGTTPVVTLEVGANLDNCNVYVTIDQDGTQVTKASKSSDDIEITKHYDENGDFDYSIVAMYLTQQETLGFEVGAARAQIRYINILDEAFGTDIATIKIEESLFQEVIEYGN